MLVIKELIVSIDIHYNYFPTVEVSGDQQLFGSSKISYFVFNIKKKMYTGLEQHEGE